MENVVNSLKMMRLYVHGAENQQEWKQEKKGTRSSRKAEDTVRNTEERSDVNRAPVKPMALLGISVGLAAMMIYFSGLISSTILVRGSRLCTFKRGRPLASCSSCQGDSDRVHFRRNSEPELQWWKMEFQDSII